MRTLRDVGVILTGATGGIGAALALELATAGAQVLAIGRSSRSLAALSERCVGSGRPGRLVPLAADITDDGDRQRIVAAARQLPRPSVLIHAAGGSAFGLFEDGTQAADEALFSVNLLAPVALTRMLLPLLEAQDDAAVVAIGSTFGSIGFPGFSTYSASKFALRGLFEALAREYADRPLRFQWLSPRATDTSFNSPAVQALNHELATPVDAPERVARQLLDAIVAGRARQQLGWPEKLFARINGVLPTLVDRGLRGKLAAIRRHARHTSVPSTSESAHDPV